MNSIAGKSRLPILAFLMVYLCVSDCSWLYITSDNEKPDLLIKSLVYSIERMPTRRTDGPSRVIRGSHCWYVFDVVVENRGASPWHGELILSYSLSEYDFRKKNYEQYDRITIDSMAVLDPRQTQEYSFSLRFLPCATDIFLILNPEFLGKTKESFYQNNEWVIKN